MKLGNRLAKKVAVALALAGLTSAGAASAAHHEKNIVETAVSAGQFNTLVAAVKAAGLVDALQGDGPFTVFAPTDEAFAKLPEGTVEALIANPDKLRSILLYHVSPGNVMAKQVVTLDSAPSLFGQDLPIDTASGVKVAGANVVKTDIECSNGVIHVIDTVMIPKNLVELAVANPNFSTLVAAVQAAGLADVLQGDGPFTVFAPTNEAFSKIPEATLQSLLKPENKDKLSAILTYHVVPGNVMAADVVKVKSAKTVQGSSVDISLITNEDKSATVKVDDAKVIATDVVGLNGVIHVIDAVIMPN